MKLIKIIKKNEKLNILINSNKKVLLSNNIKYVIKI
jgi:hypothetical protein